VVDQAGCGSVVRGVVGRGRQLESRGRMKRRQLKETQCCR